MGEGVGSLWQHLDSPNSQNCLALHIGNTVFGRRQMFFATFRQRNGGLQSAGNGHKLSGRGIKERRMKTLSDAIMEHVAGLPEAAVIRAGDLLHLGSRAAVNRALARLVKRDRLLRVYRGLYVRVFRSKFGKRLPPVHEVVRNITRITGETIAPHAGAVANGLGLTTQVPLREVYITTGRSRMLRFHALKVEMIHAPGWQFSLAPRRAGDALRALIWTGPDFSAKALRTLKGRLSEEEMQEMAAACPKLPPWLAKQVSEMVARE